MPLGIPWLASVPAPLLRLVLLDAEEEHKIDDCKHKEGSELQCQTGEEDLQPKMSQ